MVLYLLPKCFNFKTGVLTYQRKENRRMVSFRYKQFDERVVKKFAKYRIAVPKMVTLKTKDRFS